MNSFVKGNGDPIEVHSEREIQQFEDLDKQLLRRVLDVPISTPEGALHLELGLHP